MIEHPVPALQVNTPRPYWRGLLVGTLINELAGAGREVTVILDDYHLIDIRPVHEAVSFSCSICPRTSVL
jgi:ATP/maltotriose-dependent transcriptional regulator MalT